MAIYKYFDTHAHINHEPLKSQIDKIIGDTHKQGILINCVGVDLNTSIDSLKTAKKYDNVYCSVGIHPTEVESTDLSSIIKLDEMLLENHDKIIGIGETGLDYYHAEHSKKIQKVFFIKHIELAIKYNKPLILHIRNAHEDAYEIIKQYRCQLSNVLIHCFDEKKEWAKKYNELNCYMAIGGKITYPAADYLREALKEINIEHLVSETDCPWLAPVPYRAEPNTPSMMLYSIEKMAEVLLMDKDELSEILFNNAKGFFKIV